MNMLIYSVFGIIGLWVIWNILSDLIDDWIYKDEYHGKHEIKKDES